MKTNKKNIIKELKELKAENLINQFEASQDIPETYFENLSEDFLTKIKQEESTVISQKTKLRKLFLSVAVAATLLILLAIPLFNNNTESVDWDQLSTNELTNYIEQNIEEFSDEEIASVSALSDNSIFMNTDYSDEILEEYLSEMELEETLF